MNEAKRQLVQSWLTKAQRDLASARVLAASQPALLDTAIYHCQQGAEKAVKGFLVFCDQAFERIHDVEGLIRAAVPYAAGFSAWVEVGRWLTPYARIFRYPLQLRRKSHPSKASQQASREPHVQPSNGSTELGGSKDMGRQAGLRAEHVSTRATRELVVEVGSETE